MIQTVAETGSTNADLIARLNAGERIDEGHWLIANRQTAGRGRQGREWFDGCGNFMGSTVVHVRAQDPPPQTLALLAGLAVYEVVTPFCPASSSLMLKWPNDVLLGGAKLSGILLERVADTVVVGIGVNLAVVPVLQERATIALAQVGPAPDRDTFATALAATFETELERWRTYGLGTMLRRWQSAGPKPGTPLSVHEPSGLVAEGTYDGLDAQGTLQLRLEDGTVRAIHVGDVFMTDKD